MDVSPIRKKRKISRKSTSSFLKKHTDYQKHFLLNMLPYTVVTHIASYLTGADALAFGECEPRTCLDSERQFWQTLRL